MAANLDDGVSPVSSGVVPGQVIRYRFTITSSGGTSASSVQGTDALPAQVTYVSTSSSTGWSVSVSGQNVTANYTGTGGGLAASARAAFRQRRRGNEGGQGRGGPVTRPEGASRCLARGPR